MPGAQEGDGGLFQGATCPSLGRWEGLPRHSQTLQCSHKPLSQAWDGNTDKNTNTPGQAGFLSRQKHVNSAGAAVFFSHRIPLRGIDQDVTREVVFFVFLVFFFSWKFESTTLSPIIRYFSKENNSHQQAKRILWLAGLAPGFGRLASARISAFFLGLEQALAFLPASFQDFS